MLLVVVGLQMDLHTILACTDPKLAKKGARVVHTSAAPASLLDLQTSCSISCPSRAGCDARLLQRTITLPVVGHEAPLWISRLAAPKHTRGASRLVHSAIVTRRLPFSRLVSSLVCRPLDLLCHHLYNESYSSCPAVQLRVCVSDSKLFQERAEDVANGVGDSALGI